MQSKFFVALALMEALAYIWSVRAATHYDRTFYNQNSIGWFTCCDPGPHVVDASWGGVPHSNHDSDS